MMIRVSNSMRVLLAVFLAAAGPRAWACSSCGSGGADPVILNPNEASKVYLGLGLQTGFRDVDQHGELRSSYGPSSKQSLDLAFAQRLTSRIFASAVLNAGRNAYGSQSEMQNGDISVNARGNVLQQNIAEPWIPQIQLLLGHRFAAARSIYNQRSEHMLDVFGAGYPEDYAGVDVWFGMQPLLFGGSVLFGLPGKASSDAGSVQPGRMQRWIATVGNLLTDELKLIGGVIHEQRGGFTLDGEDQPHSDRLSHDLFLTMETLYSEGSNFRVTLNRRAAFGENKNGVQLNSMTLAWMRSL